VVLAQTAQTSITIVFDVHAIAFGTQNTDNITFNLPQWNIGMVAV
jgi:hypothetical protein